MSQRLLYIAAVVAYHAAGVALAAWLSNATIATGLLIYIAFICLTDDAYTRFLNGVFKPPEQEEL